MVIETLTNGLNCMMNAKKAGKEFCIVPSSKLLINVLEMMKKRNYIDYEIIKEEKKVKISVKKLNECKAINPRFNVTVGEIDKYVRRFLPSRNLGMLIISTSKGLMTHQEAIEKKTGGALIACCF